MKQKFKRFMAGFLALMTVFTSLFSSSSTAFAASESANIAFWYASVKNTGEVSELKPGYNHAKILYSIIDGNAAYCMNFGLAADGGQLMNSYDNPSTDLSDAQEKLLSYAYMKVKTEDIGYGEIYKTDKSTGTHLKGAVYGIYSDSECKKLVEKMTTDKNGYAKSGALTPGTYYVQEITAPEGYVRSDKIHTLTIKAGQTKGIDLTDVEQLGKLTIYKEGEVLSGWNGSNFTYEKRKLAGATFKVTAGADIYKADGTKVYSNYHY